MKIGYLTACISQWPLEKHLRFAKENGFESLEVACWPEGSGPCHIDVKREEKDYYQGISENAQTFGITIATLTYCPNPLSPDKKKAAEAREHIMRTIKAAAALGVKSVTTFAGRDPWKTIEENLTEFEEVFTPILQTAKEYNVNILLENCPMETHPTGENLAYSPEIWEKIFEIFPGETLGLTYDPSHLIWQGIDPIAAIAEFGRRIKHVHAKDTEVLSDRLARVGIFGRRWWRYRIPGLGEIDWAGIITALAEAGYDGSLSIEHEDPVWEGNEEKITGGLRIGLRHLGQFLP